MSLRLKLKSKDLQLDMYVAEIDRPWLDSPFLFQGFLIDSLDLLEQLHTNCKYVYVDPEKSGQAVQSHLQQLLLNPDINHKESKDKPAEDDYLSLVDQFHSARSLYSKTLKSIEAILQSASLGNRVDTDAARAVVKEMIQMVSRHPSTMIWLTYLKDKDSYTSTHSINVCIHSLSFGNWLGLDKDCLQSLGLGAILHDVGKMKIPMEIIQKPGPLNEQEWEKVKQHPALGCASLIDQPGINEEIGDIVLHHHERADGSGYPDGLEGQNIRLLTQIVGLIDVYDALCSDSCYREAISTQEALKQIYDQAGIGFESDLVEKFIRCLGVFPIGSLVELNDGSAGIVVAASEDSKLRPTLLMVLDEKKQQIRVNNIVHLSHKTFSNLRIKTILNPRDYDLDIQQIIEQEFLKNH